MDISFRCSDGLPYSVAAVRSGLAVIGAHDMEYNNIIIVLNPSVVCAGLRPRGRDLTGASSVGVRAVCLYNNINKEQSQKSCCRTDDGAATVKSSTFQLGHVPGRPARGSRQSNGNDNDTMCVRLHTSIKYAHPPPPPPPPPPLPHAATATAATRPPARP